MLIASVLLIALGASQLRFVGPAHAPLIRLSGPMALAFGLAHLAAALAEIEAAPTIP